MSNRSKEQSIRFSRSLRHVRLLSKTRRESGHKVAADHTLDSLIDGDFLTDPERKIALAVHLIVVRQRRGFSFLNVTADTLGIKS